MQVRPAELAVDRKRNPKSSDEGAAEAAPNLATIRADFVRLFHKWYNKRITLTSLRHIGREGEIDWLNVIKVPEMSIASP